MTPEEAEAVVRRVFGDCNKGAYSYHLSEYLDAAVETLLSLGDPLATEIDRLTKVNKDDLLRDVVAEVTCVYIVSVVDDRTESRHQRDRIVLSAEVCIAEHVYEVTQKLSQDFTPGDLWVALIHFESDERVEPFTTDYFSASPDLKRKFIAHACLDISLPGAKVPDNTLAYAAGNLELLPEICAVVLERKTFQVESIVEAMKIHPKSISSGIL